MISITLVPIEEFQFRGKGKYLVRTTSTIKNTPFKPIHYLSVNVDINENNKLSFDVNGQMITHISTEIILDNSIFGGKDLDS